VKEAYSCADLACATRRKSLGRGRGSPESSAACWPAGRGSSSWSCGFSSAANPRGWPDSGGGSGLREGLGLLGSKRRLSCETTADRWCRSGRSTVFGLPAVEPPLLYWWLLVWTLLFDAGLLKGSITCPRRPTLLTYSDYWFYWFGGCLLAACT